METNVVLDTRDKGLKLKVSAIVQKAVKNSMSSIKAGVTDDRGNIVHESDEIEITAYTDLELGIRVPGVRGPRYFSVIVKERM